MRNCAATLIDPPEEARHGGEKHPDDPGADGVGVGGEGRIGHGAGRVWGLRAGTNKGRRKRDASGGL
ncbi:hypothetical protein HMPREF9440_01288 [Sutterella parvirubra YIT 11816]|uniref:Uncharacterized protein n=1 Tax=Sutterella parvirubra YIT 11816 TaxID=762967 RepID=H3KEX4_9BURK|nr:hypothetical protein HMPREF9440_01288 [Sutterella parvirubra YIT 11816]